MSEKAKKALKYTISISGAIILLYFSFRGVKWEDFMAVLSNCRWGYVLASMSTGVFVTIVRGHRWRLTILPFHPKCRYSDTINGNAMGNVTNMVIPLSSELVRCAVVQADAEDKNVTYDKILGTAALERLWDMACIVLMSFILLAAKWDVFGVFFMDKIAGPISAKFGGGAWIIALALVVSIVAACYAVYALRNKNAVCGAVSNFLKGIFQGLASFGPMKHKWLFLLDTVSIWFIYWLQIVLMSLALPDVLSLSMSDCLFISLVGSAASVVPVPGGFGAFHFLAATALSSIYGLGWDQGIAFATLVHESHALAFIGLGIFSALSEASKKRGRVLG